ncbi:MAG TPA: hypothetical protein VH081_03370 [Solirubrobacteraceae bacterium]|nr:hypothetical protein [Solirubrobacteraceae bacterium]
MRLDRALALALVAVSLSACETTAEKSAKLERQAKHVAISEKGLTITRENAAVKVLAATLVRDSERAAAAITVQNRSAGAQRDVPLAITVKDARGRTLFQNNGPGLEGALVSIPSIAAHQTITWVDDQLPPGGAPASVSARVGAAPALRRAPPTLSIGSERLSEDPAEGLIATGVVSNHTKVAQSGVAVFAVARRHGKIVAAGRAVIPQLGASASTPFQVAFVGEARGARLQLVAPAASFGE